ncbi:MAG: hypothetical protein ACRC2T_10805 [Thermoguttaceae bacterium]
MKTQIIIAFIFLMSLFCVNNTPTVNTIPEKYPCAISVFYSQCTRESTFNGYRDGILFKTDTLKDNNFNGVKEHSTNCDSIVNFWESYIGKIYHDTTTCFYGPDTARWLDTFYFKYLIDSIVVIGHD